MDKKLIPLNEVVSNALVEGIETGRVVFDKDRGYHMISLVKLVGEEVLHDYSQKEIAEVAFGHNLVIPCCSFNRKIEGHHMIRPNGQWIQIPDGLKKKAEDYTGYSHSFCDSCFESEMKKLY